jgi:hypothetical protein
LKLSNFVLEDDSPTADSFLVEVNGHEIHAQTRVSSFMAADLGNFFADLARNWKGWEGAKVWSTLEGDFQLSAASDSVGHVRLAYSLRPADTGFNWELRGALEVEAGQLEHLAIEAARAWNRDAP